MTQIKQKYQQYGKAHQGSCALIEIPENQRGTRNQQQQNRQGQETDQTQYYFFQNTLFPFNYGEPDPYCPGSGTKQHSPKQPEIPPMKKQSNFVCQDTETAFNLEKSIHTQFQQWQALLNNKWISNHVINNPAHHQLCNFPLNQRT